MLHGTSMLISCCIAVRILLHCCLIITNAVAGTYCVPGTTCMACAPGTCSDAVGTAPCTQTATGSNTCSCSASPVPDSTVCDPWGRCTLLLPHYGTSYTLKHSILQQTTDRCRKICLFWRVCIACMAHTHRPEWLQRKLKHCSEVWCVRFSASGLQTVTVWQTCKHIAYMDCLYRCTLSVVSYMSI